MYVVCYFVEYYVLEFQKFGKILLKYILYEFLQKMVCVLKVMLLFIQFKNEVKYEDCLVIMDKYEDQIIIMYEIVFGKYMFLYLQFDQWLIYISCDLRYKMCLFKCLLNGIIVLLCLYMCIYFRINFGIRYVIFLYLFYYFV